MAIDEARRELMEVLEACRAVEERRMNPFLLDVSQALRVASRHFPSWRSLEDLCLDARVLNAISRVLQLQEARLRYEAGLFFADPEALVEKVRRIRLRDLSRIFLEAWHPVVELQQVSVGSLRRARSYWESMVPPPEEELPPMVEPDVVSEEELAALGILSREGFLRDLGDLWEELRVTGEQDYWDFVRGGDPEDVVRRAYGLSFLLSYGYAEMEVMDGRMTIRANSERRPRRDAVSLPVVVTGGP